MATALGAAAIAAILDGSATTRNLRWSSPGFIVAYVAVPLTVLCWVGSIRQWEFPFARRSDRSTPPPMVRPSVGPPALDGGSTSTWPATSPTTTSPPTLPPNPPTGHRTAASVMPGAMPVLRLETVADRQRACQQKIGRSSQGPSLRRLLEVGYGLKARAPTSFLVSPGTTALEAEVADWEHKVTAILAAADRDDLSEQFNSAPPESTIEGWSHPLALRLEHRLPILEAIARNVSGTP
jgi:hypothetical protein